MKNKRTKLTALLLSALMAVSTISSVTWAADLFSDGSSIEEINEETAETESDVEAELDSDDVALVGVSEITSVVFKNIKNVIYAVYTDEDGIEHQVEASINGNAKDATCFAPQIAIYYATLPLTGVDDFTVYSSDDGETVKPSNWNGNGAKITVDSSCKTWGNEKYQITEKGYIVVPGTSSLTGIYGHKPTMEPVILRESGCDSFGVQLIYRHCEKCGIILSSDGTELQIAGNKVNLSVDEAIKIGFPGWNSTNLEGERTASLNDVPFMWTESLPKNEHNYDEENPIIVSDLNYDFYAKNYKVENVGGYSTFSQFAPYNCKMENGKMVTDPENEYDAYYFTIVVCKNCKTVKFWDKVYLKDTSGELVGTFYEKVTDGNIIGFFGKNRNEHYYFYDRDVLANDTNANTRKDGRIDSKKLADPPEPIFVECGKLGYYYVNTYVTDTPEAVTSERKPAQSNHSWGPVEVIPNGVQFTDGSKSSTEDSKLLTTKDDPSAKYVSNGFVVVESNGDVTEAKSFDCITTAKYQLGRYCLNCGKVLKYDDIKTAEPNKDRHQWGDWSNTTDPADDAYYLIDENSHRRVTYKHRICSKCGERGKKLDNEFVEPHNLIETVMEDEPKQEPTCGFPGFETVQLVCKCTFKDDSSKRQSKIPATDDHDFGSNEVELKIKGDVLVGKDGRYDVKKGETPYVVYAEVVRKCNVCEQYDSNGISNTPAVAGSVGVDEDLIIDTVREGRTIEIKEASSNYPCSVGSATITFDWSGKVDGVKTVRVQHDPITVPYYPSVAAYAGRRDHVIDVRYEEEVKPTATQEGSRVKVTFCKVCGDVLSSETETLAKLGSAPTVKAAAVNYNTVTVTWDAVEGAESYKVYNKSNALGINKWQAVATVTGTTYTDTGLVTGAKYRYTVRPVVDEVPGEYSKKGVVVCPKLTAPEIKSVTSIGTNKNKITWTKVDGASGYIVQRKTTNGSWTRIATVRGGSNINCRDKKAVAGASYRVRAFRTVEKPNFVKSNVYGPFSTAK